uniref:MAM domain-containing protein n=1 Tax=Echinococcus canadensis TaxID=519352 RepID=A0A915EYT1_9CEST
MDLISNLQKETKTIIVTALFTLTLASWASASVHSTSFSVAGSMTPKAECKFDKGMCGWRSDPTNPWLITTLNKSTPQFPLPNSSWPILCPSKEVLQEANSGESWFADDVNPSAFKTPQYLIRTRLRSPSVPASLGLRCLTLSSFFHLGRRVGAARGHLGLTLLLQKPGAFLESPSFGGDGPASPTVFFPWFCGVDENEPVTMAGNEANDRDRIALFPLSFSPGLSWSIKPLAVCDFDDGETCGWMHEEAVWSHRWAIEQGYLCLAAKVPSSSSRKKTSSWVSSLSSGQRKPTADARVRFASAPISAVVGVKCIVFVYSINLARGKASNLGSSFGSLTLLQQQEGPYNHVLKWFATRFQTSHQFLLVDNGGISFIPPSRCSTFSETPLIKPVAVCNFNDGDTCGWMHEGAIWTHRWEAEQGYLCLKAKMSTFSSKMKTSSWLPGLSTSHRKPSADIRVRFTSPPVPSAFGLKCIAFGYSIGLEQSSSLLKPLAVCDFDDGETCGWVHEEVPWAYRWAIVRDRLCLKAKVPLNSPSKKISSWLRGLAIDQSSDEIDIKVRFSSPPIPASFGVKCVVFVYSMDFGREKTSKPVRASGSLSLLQQQKGYFFWQLPISTMVMCLVECTEKPHEHIDGQLKQSLSSSLETKVCRLYIFHWSWPPKVPPILSELLEVSLYASNTCHPTGCCKSSLGTCRDDIFMPFHVWTFEEGDMEDWSNDNNNGQQKWHVGTTHLPSSSICVSAKASGKKSKKIFSPTYSKKTSSRLWSPSVSGSLGINCITIRYAIERASRDAKTPPKPFFVWTFNENTGKWTNDAANWHQKWELINGAICLRNVPSESGESDDTMFWLSLNTVKEDTIRNTKALLWSPPIPQSVGMRCITMNYLIDMFSENSEAHHTLPKPLFMYIFDENIGGWVNDISNYHQKWELIKGAICLHNVPADTKISSGGVPWFSANSRKEDKATRNPKAPLWSPPVPQTVGMRCVTIDYHISFNDVESGSYSLALLQQQDGGDFDVGFLHILLVVFVLFSVDTPPKPYYVWTFTENTGKWINDISNWHQKWELMDGAVCLRNVPIETATHPEDIPWLSENAEVKDRIARNSKAPLWSPPIPHSLGMRCITMDYKITAETEDTDTYSLAMLQQQDGWAYYRPFSPVFVSHVPPKPYFVWTFDEDTGGWVNDILNWNQRWQLIDSAICLCNVPDEPKKYTKALPWLSLVDKTDKKVANNAKAPLWSPPIPQAVGMRCIEMDYSISVDPVESAPYSLAMLHQQEGPFLLSSLDALPKPFFVWTFNENTGKWTNDAANQRQKWELMSGVICLHNVPIEIEGSSDDMSWLSLTDEGEEKATKGAKVLFWSPLIPHVVGMRCIAMDYRIGADFEVAEKYSLAILQQQDGLSTKTLVNGSTILPIGIKNGNALMEPSVCTMHRLNLKLLLTTCLGFLLSRKRMTKLIRCTKSPLWSPPISEAVGMRCITMNYLIHVGSVVSGAFELAMLQQQD